MRALPRRTFHTFEQLEYRRLLAFDIVINAGPGLAADPLALSAFNRAAEQWEAHITDDIIVTINADLADLQSSTIIGQASNVALQGAYDVLRNQLVADAADEADDSIVAMLPTSSQASFLLPTGFGVSGNLVGAKAALKAAGFTGLDQQFGITDATITFNSQFAFDYDSSDGVSVGSMDFETVAAHEIGHALGFTSQVDLVDYYSGGTLSPGILDLFRFEDNTTHDPESLADFQTFSRSLNAGVAANTDQISSNGDAPAEMAMSTGVFKGDGRQASHWKDNNLTGETIGILDPTLSYQQVIQISHADLRALDLIGYDIQFGTTDVVNTAPVATDDTATIGRKSGTASGNVLSNDSDPQGDSLSATLDSGPAHGSVQFSSDGSFVYTPDATFTGSDSFTYVANDGEFDSNVAVVAVGAKTGGGGKGGKEDSGDGTGGGNRGGGKGGKPTKVTSDASMIADDRGPAFSALASYNPAAELRSHIQADEVLAIMFELHDRDETGSAWTDDYEEDVVQEAAMLLAASDNSYDSLMSSDGRSVQATDELYALLVIEGDDDKEDSSTLDEADTHDLAEPLL